MGAHSETGPSQIAQILACPGSARAQRGLPDDSSYDSRLGTAAHTLLANCLGQERDAAFFVGDQILVDDEAFSVTEEMADAVQVCVDYVRSTPGEDPLLEHRVEIPYLNTFGTADVIKYDPPGRTLYVIDYKHGAGVFVSGEDNAQLKAYGLGAWGEYSDQDVDRVVTVIVQPRMDNISVATYAPAQLIDWAKRIAPVLDRARNDPDAPRAPGPAQCQFCRAKATCPEVRDLVVDTTDIVFEDLAAAPDRGAELAAMLPKLRLIEDWCSAVAADAHRHLMSGKAIPGYKLVSGRRGPRVWSDPAKAEELMRDKFRLLRDDMYVQRVVSPPAAEALLAQTSPRRWKQLVPLITQSPARVAVAPESDKRPALKVAPLQFDNLTNQSYEDLA